MSARDQDYIDLVSATDFALVRGCVAIVVVINVLPVHLLQILNKTPERLTTFLLHGPSTIIFVLADDLGIELHFMTPYWEDASTVLF